MDLTRVSYDNKEINKIIVSNILKMFKRRNLIENIEEAFNSIENDISPNKSIKVKLLNNQNSMIYIINDKVTSITQNSPIDDFLSKDVNIFKFVIIREPSKKTFKQVIENYPNSEIFFQNEFMEDIPAKEIIPEHRLLNEEEKKELFDVIEMHNLKKIYTTDMMSRYFNAKPEEIFRINRKNSTSGNGIDYRVVVNGKLDLLF